MASTSTSTPVAGAVIPAIQTDNHFAMHDAENKTQIVYNLQKGGPARPNSNVGGPELIYTGPHGNRSFSGTQVSVMTTPIGSMITVTMDIVPDQQILTLSLVMPTVVNAKPGSPQSFQTLAVFASHRTTLLGPPPTGGDPTYTVLKLQGEASHVEIAD